MEKEMMKTDGHSENQDQKQKYKQKQKWEEKLKLNLKKGQQRPAVRNQVTERIGNGNDVGMIKNPADDEMGGDGIGCPVEV
jgi:hypothetical protein